MGIKNLEFVGIADASSETHCWHEFRSPVSVCEAMDLYQGCKVRNGEDYLEVIPHFAMMRDVGKDYYKPIELGFFVPTIMPRREEFGHYLPFECVLRDDIVLPLFGYTASSILALSVDAYVYPCKVDLIEERIWIKSTAELDEADYILVYSDDEKITSTPQNSGFMAFTTEIMDKDIYFVLVPIMAVHLITPFDHSEIKQILLNSQRIAEETEYTLAHSKAL